MKKSERFNAAETLANGIVQSMVSIEIMGNTERIGAAIFRKDRSFVVGSDMWQFKDDCVSEPPEQMEAIDKKLVWGGEMLNHYGHFLLQSTARLYYYLQNKGEYDGILFAWNWKIGIPRYMLDFFELAGVPLDKVFIAFEPLVVRELAVPSMSGYFYRDWTEDFLLPFKNVAAEVAPAGHKKIYLSRRKWEAQTGFVLGEEEIELAFSKNGFEPIYPESMSLREQIAAIKGADDIAGVYGTALHNILFAVGGGKKRLIMLERSEFASTQQMLCEAAGADFVSIMAYHNFLPVENAYGPFVVGMTEQLRQFFKDNGMNDFGMEFKPESYAREFMKMYAEIYSVPENYKSLVNCKGNKIDVQDLVRALRGALG